MRKFVYLSYALDAGTPIYPGDRPVSVTGVRKIRNGDSCNTSSIDLSSHAGTHMDVPYHFLEKGKRLSDYRQDEFVFDNIYSVDCPKKAAEAIGPGEIRITNKSRSADILLVRTGFERYRSKDPETYRSRNPYFSPRAAEYIVKAFPRLRAIGIDTISVSSKVDHISGREAHRILLGSGIVIIEDMRFPRTMPGLKRVVVFPLFRASPDGSPCVIMGF